MSKRARRNHRRQRSRTALVSREVQRRSDAEGLVVGGRESSRLLHRLLAVPDLANVVPRLPPEVVHRVIQQCGLEDCSEFVALATPAQLARVFDLDLWRPELPGLDERFDADRFGRWLEVLVDAGVSTAAATLAAIDLDLVAAGLAQHARVFDHAAVAPFVTLDGQEVSPGRSLDDDVHASIGGYVLVAKRPDSWDAITTVLAALADAHGAYFHRLMSRCRRVSNSRPEVDGLDDLLTADAQAMFDLALDREERRDAQGYVTAAQARAFLQAARRIDLRQGAAPPRDPMAQTYFTRLEKQLATEDPHEASASRLGASPDTPAPDASAVAAVVDLLPEDGDTPGRLRAQLADPGGTTPSFARVRAHLLFAHAHAPESYAKRTAELAYLANVLVAGSTIQTRPIPPTEASHAALAVCNLGLEHWPAPLPEDLLVRHDLIGAFQVGWTILHEDVCMSAAEALIGALSVVRAPDAEIHASIGRLQTTLLKHWRAGSPWAAREALDVIACLDMPAWAALLGLIDQFPTLHASVGATLAGATHQIEASAFELISENAHLQQIRAFLRRLPDMLGG